ncbi:MAG: hypothetical protein H0V25_08135, partial [Solirubrobacterales bacterium]|nr:hypothetical protein [Solirubrobacterales bacterium]
TAGAFADRLEAALGGRPPTTPVAHRSETRTTVMARPGSDRVGDRRRSLALTVGAIVLAAGAVLAFLLIGGDDGGGGGAVAAPTVVTKPVGKSPVGVAVGDVRIWVASRDAPPPTGGPPGEIYRLRRDSPVQAKEPIPLPGPRAVAVGLSSVWVVNGEALYEVGGGAVPQPIEVGDKPTDVTVDNNFVWVSNEEGDSVTRVDPSSIDADGRPTTETIGVGDEPRSIAADRGNVWVANAGSGTVTRIDADRLKVTATVPVGPQPTSIAVGPSSAWVTDNAEDDMREIDVRTAEQVGTPIPVEPSPRGVAVGLASVWVASGAANVVERFDGDSRTRIGDPIAVGPDPADIAVGVTAVYTANQSSGTVSRILP